jgi:hypothetical protein
MVLLGDMVKLNLVLVHLEIVVISVQDRCTVGAEYTIGMEIILGTPDGTPKVTCVRRNLVLVCLEIVLISAQDWCKGCAKCTIGIEII